MKSGIENLSGHSMDDLKVHYNSDKPAQFHAHAYAQGTEIHGASCQEKHLPHEAWHVVQQKQGRVKPTMQMKGKVNINDDVGLEKEADIMGEKAKLFYSSNSKNNSLVDRRFRQSTIQKKEVFPPGDSVIQRQIIIGKSILTPGDAMSNVVFRERMFEDSMNSKMIESIRAILKIYDSKSLSFQSVQDFKDTLTRDVGRVKDRNIEDIGLPEYDIAEPAMDDSSDEEHSDEEIDEKEMEPAISFEKAAFATKHVFGLKIGEYDPAKVPTMYRSVERAEFLGIIQSMLKTGRPDFSHKESAKGKAEKFFAPNKAYVVESMGKKGKRSILLEIAFHPSVYELVYATKNTGLDENSVGSGFDGLSVEKQSDPKPIKIKQESPKKKKGISYVSYNIGFRKDGALLQQFSSKIIAINIVDHKYDLKEVKKRF